MQGNQYLLNISHSIYDTLNLIESFNIVLESLDDKFEQLIVVFNRFVDLLRGEIFIFLEIKVFHEFLYGILGLIDVQRRDQEDIQCCVEFSELEFICHSNVRCDPLSSLSNITFYVKSSQKFVAYFTEISTRVVDNSWEGVSHRSCRIIVLFREGLDPIQKFSADISDQRVSSYWSVFCKITEFNEFRVKDNFFTCLGFKNNWSC